LGGSVSKKRPLGKRQPARKAAPRIYHPGPPIDGEAALAVAAAELARLDPKIIGHLVEIGGAPPLRRREPGFAGLAAIIVSQQVSVASATAIYGRLEARFAPLEAIGVLAATDDDLRGCGLSTPKIKALRALAAAVQREGLDLAALAEMDAREAHARLVKVSGIGPWTADIFLLFCLGHPDAFPAGDLALQEAARLALGLKARPDARALENIAERWRPYRGVAARMLWAFYRVAKQRSGMALADAATLEI
jgi:DNA-3-methyladenine glycosylase II